MINMGPIQPMIDLPGGLKPNPQSDGLGYNPRCLRRDLSLQSANETRDDLVSSLIKDNPTMAKFQRVFEGDFDHGVMGTHAGGHYTIGGDAGSDFFSKLSYQLMESSF